MKPVFLALMILTLASCGKKTSSSADIEEAAQQVGDVAASIDEAGGSGGAIAMLEPGTDRTFKRYGYGPAPLHFGIPTANAATCGAATFGSCTSNTLTRTYGGCTVGGGTFSGTVTLTWGGTSSNCTLGAANDTITRVPNFTVTGRRGATLTVSKTGSIGQRLTWVSGTGSSKVFSFSNDGIRRAFTASGTTLFDHTTSTVSAITVTGTSRSSRTLSGGTLRTTNNVSGLTCDFVPSSVSWSTGCNCPVSGSWSATCSDGTSSTLTHTGCGTANFTLGADSTAVTFDRCL
jgi:hypothetical protein